MKTRVLVVDDDRLVADTLSWIYASNGYECEARYSAVEGFRCAREFNPALILCDITMPVESGFVLAQQVIGAMPAIRMLMFTGYPANVPLALQHTQQDSQPLKVLQKPCRPDDLLRETRAMLEQ